MKVAIISTRFAGYLAAFVVSGLSLSLFFRADHALGSQKGTRMSASIKHDSFGKTADGVDVSLYTLSSGNGLEVSVMTYGAIITSVKYPDRQGKSEEITLGFDTLAEYEKGHPYFGAICGRVANRIAKGQFTLDGKSYQVAKNNGENHLHGGVRGFDKAVWKASPTRSESDDRAILKLSHVSPDGDEGYPGKLEVTVTYTVFADNSLQIEYVARSDKATPLNLTNHTYWNLMGGARGDVLEHEVQLNADRYLPVDSGMIPTGELASVADTPMDFRKPHKIGERIEMVPGGPPGGYDHCYVINQKKAGELTVTARVFEPYSGRVMEVSTTEPGVQLYTGNFLDGTLKSRGATLEKRTGFCLEAQHFPDGVNQPEFPNTVLRPGETYTQKTVHKFSVLSR